MIKPTYDELHDAFQQFRGMHGVAEAEYRAKHGDARTNQLLQAGILKHMRGGDGLRLTRRGDRLHYPLWVERLNRR